MRLSVKYYVMQQKMKEKMAQEINMAFQQQSSKSKNLVAENEAKTQALDWIHSYIISGSKSTMPRPFLTPDQRKKLEIMKDEHLFGPYINFLNANDINDKITIEQNMGKVFPILVFNLSSIFGEIGLFQQNEKFLERPGNSQKFAFKSS